MLWYRGSTGRRGGEGWLECCGIEGPQVEGGRRGMVRMLWYRGSTGRRGEERVG